MMHISSWILFSEPYSFSQLRYLNCLPVVVVGCVRGPFGLEDTAPFGNFSAWNSSDPITQIDVATYGGHTVG